MEYEKAKERLLSELPKPFGEWAARQVDPRIPSLEPMKDDAKIHEILFNAFSWSDTKEGTYFWEAVYDASGYEGKFPLGGLMWAGWSVVVWEDRLTIGCQKIDSFHFLVVKDWLNKRGGIDEFQTGGGYEVELQEDIMVIEEAKVITKTEVRRLILEIEEFRAKKEK